jgi:hypothetical protein
MSRQTVPAKTPEEEELDKKRAPPAIPAIPHTGDTTTSLGAAACPQYKLYTTAIV